NAYCQDSPLSWYDWDLDERQQSLLEFTRRLIRLRLEHPVLHRRKFFLGRHIRGSDVEDLAWFRPDGAEMTDDDWSNGELRALGMRLGGDALTEIDERGQPVTDDTLLVLLNADHERLPFILPSAAA